MPEPNKITCQGDGLNGWLCYVMLLLLLAASVTLCFGFDGLLLLISVPLCVEAGLTQGKPELHGPKGMGLGAKGWYLLL